MKNTKLYWLSILFAFLFLTACNKDEDEPTPTPQINESEVLATFLESTSSPLMKDFVNTDMPTIMPASEVKTLNATGQVYIIDIRSADDFNNLGHIENAHNVAFGDLITHVAGINMDDYTKVAIVCYSGQTAGYAASILRLMGYDKVFSMKWGMCSWHEDFSGSWSNAVANGNAYATQFTSDPTDKGPSGNMPTLSTGKTDGLSILEARVDAVIAEGFDPAKISNSVVFANLSNYYIVNYWPAAHYETPGHIPGAMQYTPKESIKTTADLKTLPTDKTIVVYCYTGQTSAFLAAYLRLLGYDAKSLLFGTNGMIYDMMVDEGLTTFNDEQIMGYDYVN
jgi:rhodanese-related sulfurtransferase